MEVKQGGEEESGSGRKASRVVREESQRKG